MTVSTLAEVPGVDAVTVLVTVTVWTTEADRVTVTGSFNVIVTVLIAFFVTVIGVGQKPLYAAGVILNAVFCALTTAKMGSIAR